MFSARNLNSYLMIFKYVQFLKFSSLTFDILWKLCDKKLLSQHFGVLWLRLTALFRFLADIVRYRVQWKCRKTVIAVPRRSRVERILGTRVLGSLLRVYFRSSPLEFIITARWSLYRLENRRISGFVNVTDQCSFYKETFVESWLNLTKLVTIVINFYI